MAKARARKKRDRDIPLTLHPLNFEEALADLMKVKPPKETPKKTKKRRR
jgi:hypothetical protein